MTSEKSKTFNKVLTAAKDALDSINIPFHLHSGTALGVHRENDFIAHDDDIDLAVFYHDINKSSQIKKIVKAMKDNGFVLEDTLGTLSRGFELKFYDKDTEIPLDIFWVYSGKYRGKKYYILSSYYGKCDQYKHSACVWGYRPYKTVKKRFLGHTYNVMPKQTLVDAYGKDWKVPKKFSYDEGLENGYNSMIPDYYDPKDISKKIAFCFLVYDKVKHGKVWSDFFKGYNLPVKSYSIYAHIKHVTDKTQPWLKDNKIRTIKTEWCGDNLVWAWINMLKEALKDKSNQYFVILSGECIPLYNFWDTYNQITSSKKSRINIDPNADSTFDTGLAYADQWVILNRKHAELMVKMRTTQKGKAFVKKTRKQKTWEYCADEIYPINWFIYNYGKPYSSTFKKQFNLIPATYTYWDGKKPHPIKYTTSKMRSHKNRICGSDALFARKFNEKSALELAGTCKVKKSKSARKSMRKTKVKKSKSARKSMRKSKVKKSKSARKSMRKTKVKKSSRKSMRKTKVKKSKSARKSKVKKSARKSMRKSKVKKRK